MRGRRVQAVLCMLGPITLCLVLSWAVYPALHITSGSIREALSIPAQQTARCVREHEGDVMAEQRDAIDKVFSYQAMLEDYDPSLSDRVKNTYRKECTSEELRAFLETWVELVSEHPGSAFAATAKNYYGWFYPMESYIHYGLALSEKQGERMATATNGSVVIENKPSFLTNPMDGAYQAAFTVWDSVPPFNMLTQACTWDWLLLVCLVYALHRRSADAVPLMLLVLILIVVLTGPCNFVARYLFQTVFVLPFFVSVIFGRYGGGSLTYHRRSLR